MNSCKHKTLALVPLRTHKLRCRHCHLTITEEELGSGCCPECFEVTGEKRRDFETVAADGISGTVRYCCEECGMVIDCKPVESDKPSRD